MISKYDIIKLDDGKEYSVLEYFIKDEIVHIIAVEVDEEENLILENLIFLKNVNNEVIQILDEEELNELTPWIENVLNS